MIFVLAATLAVVLAALWRRATAIAIATAVALATDLARLALLAALSPPVPLPLAALDSALFLAWPAALAGACLVALAGASPAPALVALALATAEAALLPAQLEGIYLAAELVAGVTGTLCCARWLLSDRPATRERVALSILGVGHAVVVLGGAYRVDLWQRWDLHRAGYAVLLAAVFAILLVPRRG